MVRMSMSTMEGIEREGKHGVDRIGSVQTRIDLVSSSPMTNTAGRSLSQRR